MKRPAHIWIAFGVCLATVLAVMAWQSATALRLDRAQRQARRQADVDEKVRLALWRMDAAVAGLLAEESARPYFVYQPMFPSDRPYANMYRNLQEHDRLVPSPLLNHGSRRILLYFEVDPGGALSSPEVPAPGLMDRLAPRFSKEDVDRCAERLSRLRGLFEARMDQVLAAAGPSAPAVLPSATPQGVASAGGLSGRPAGVSDQGSGEWQARRGHRDRAVTSQLESNALWNQAVFSDPLAVGVGLPEPLWIDSQLLLVRQVRLGGEIYIQGAWLNWPILRAELLGAVGDLLPEADLEPVTTDDAADPDLLLATIPLRLIPGELPAPVVAGISPMHLSLGIAWLGLGVAAVAVIVLLRGIIALSERRAAFVGAVTHELRTPLTTFRMYTEMLDEGMVTEEAKRRQYVKKLRGEAERLGNLVENVLSYARLEGGRSHPSVCEVALDEVFERCRARLSERAQAAGMKLHIQNGREDDIRAIADPAAVEQILFNLIDNACKYAARAVDTTIHIETRVDHSGAQIRVRDHGPGIAGASARRLFEPFAKPDRDVTESAPGVGLGLALCRRLAREMGGDVHVDAAVTDGACLVLTLRRPQASGFRPRASDA